MITQRALLFGFVGFCFYLIAIVNALPPFYYALTWLTAGVLVSCFGIALLSLLGVECRWTAHEVHVTERLPDSVLRLRPVLKPLDEAAGRGASSREKPAAENTDDIVEGPGVELQLYNGGSLNKTDVVVEVRLRSVHDKALFTHRFLIEALPAGSNLDTTLPLFDLPRGRYRVEELRLIGSDVLGLFRMRKRVPPQAGLESENSAQTPIQSTSNEADAMGGAVRKPKAPLSGRANEVVVGPAMVALPNHAEAWRGGGVSGGLGTVATLGQGDEVRGTRPYVAGDDLRFVHWKSTARRGELVVREFHHLAQPQSLVIWDGSRVSPNDAASEAAVEHALRLVASLCGALRDIGQPCGLLRLDRQPLWVPPLRRDLFNAVRLVETLADAQADREEPFDAALAPWLGQMAPGTQIFIFSLKAESVVAVAPMLLSQRMRYTLCFVDHTQFGTASKLKAAVDTIQSTLHGVGQAKSSVGNALFGQENVLREYGMTVRAPRHPLIGSKATSRILSHENEANSIRQTLSELLHGPAWSERAPMEARSVAIDKSLV